MKPGHKKKNEWFPIKTVDSGTLKNKIKDGFYWNLLFSIKLPWNLTTQKFTV